MGTRRRLRGLAVLGLNLREISALTGLPARSLEAIRQGRYSTVTLDVALRVRDLAGQLIYAGTPPTPTRARQKALRDGWAPLMAWNNRTIANPNAVPDYGPETPRDVLLWIDALQGRFPTDDRPTISCEHPRALRDAAIAFLTAVAGMSVNDIAEYLGVPRTIVRRARTNFRRLGYRFTDDDQSTAGSLPAHQLGVAA